MELFGGSIKLEIRPLDPLQPGGIEVPCLELLDMPLMGCRQPRIAGIAPQQNPSVFSRSGVGGHWGAELKYAGYDGIVILGQADNPVYLPMTRTDIGDYLGLTTETVSRTFTQLRAQRIISAGSGGRIWLEDLEILGTLMEGF